MASFTITEELFKRLLDEAYSQGRRDTLDQLRAFVPTNRTMPMLMQERAIAVALDGNSISPSGRYRARLRAALDAALNPKETR